MPYNELKLYFVTALNLMGTKMFVG